MGARVNLRVDESIKSLRRSVTANYGEYAVAAQDRPNSTSFIKTEAVAMNTVLMNEMNKSQMSTRAAIKKAREQGFTLIEILVVLAIIALIAVAGAALVGDGFSGTTVNSEREAFRSMTHKIRGIYSTAPDFTGLTTITAIDSGAVPVGRVSGTGASRVVTNGFGGEFQFIVNTGNSRLMTGTITAVPSADCVKMITGLWDSYNTIGLAASETDVKSGPAVAVSPPAVITACNTAATNTINFVTGK